MRTNQAVIAQTSFLIQCNSCKNCERSAENAYFGAVVKDLEKKGWKFTTHSYPIKFDEVTNVNCPDCEAKRLAELRKSDSVYDRIQGGFYGNASQDYEQFKKDALKEVGLTNHPKADKAYSFAWEHGHASGYSSIIYWLEEVSQLLK